MAKFNVTVELDWMDEEFNIDDEIRDTIINTVVSRVQERIVSQVENECNNKINQQMANIEQSVSAKLNEIMDEFFDEPRDVTDQYGDVIKKGITVRETLKKACNEFMTESLDQYGNPTKSHWDIKYKTRVDYLVAKSMDSEMDRTIKRTVDEVTKKIKDKVSEEVKKQMGEKLAGILELDKLIGK